MEVIEPILKRNLQEGQVVYYFTPPCISSDGLDYHNKKSTIQRLEFQEFYTGRHSGKCTLFLNEKGIKRKFYDSIKGLMFHTQDEAINAFNKQTVDVKIIMLNNTKKYIKKMQKQADTLEAELIKL